MTLLVRNADHDADVVTAPALLQPFLLPTRARVPIPRKTLQHREAKRKTAILRAPPAPLTTGTLSTSSPAPPSGRRFFWTSRAEGFTFA